MMMCVRDQAHRGLQGPVGLQAPMGLQAQGALHVPLMMIMMLMLIVLKYIKKKTIKEVILHKYHGLQVFFQLI